MCMYRNTGNIKSSAIGMMILPPFRFLRQAGPGAVTINNGGRAVRTSSRIRMDARIHHLPIVPIRTMHSGPSTNNSTNHTAQSLLYLHLGPAGDCWTGASIFAAKHMQPDYVKSILLPNAFVVVDDEDTFQSQSLSAVDLLLEDLQDDPVLAQQIYDGEQIPERVLQRAILLGSKNRNSCGTTMTT